MTQEKSFYSILLGKTKLTTGVIIGVALLYILLMSFIDHKSIPVPIVILFLASIKTFIIASSTMKQLSRVIEICHSLERIIIVFGFIIGVSIFSFATDYNCLYQFDPMAFNGLSDNSELYV